ncbi:hypothetical protein GCM10020358_80810 [Amorphoplanes nipponensis]|uniref:Uncharacterized protein n=1 Tax=Actinoplanes nipponensis TaxID=135950 RepID=A0A919ML90_9ACTN|nr:hypothetical protein [Actinoplanes nipponensis]GIE49281.1 hypothetical protein Ani05nite_28150 [Actinoplanes nipponensis]
MLAAALGARPAGLGEALAAVDGLDDALGHGLAHLDQARAARLEPLAAACAGSPLAGRVADAVAGIVAGTVTDDHLTALAGARSALLGAAHDALLAEADAALGRAREPWSAATVPARPGHLPAAGRSWLRELALTGWRRAGAELVGSGGRTVQALIAEPAARRLAVLLEGFAAELRAAAPVAPAARIPARRWADLWARALLLGRGGLATAGTVDADGRLLLLGADLHEHPTVVHAQVHGLLESPGRGVRLVRTAVAAAKVDAVSGPSVWRRLAAFPVLRAALARHRAIEVSGLPLTPGGDLIWQESRAALGGPADPFVTARVRLAAAVAAAPPPLDRHPVAIAEPVLLEGYAAGQSTFDLGGAEIAVDLDRLPAAGPLTPALVAASTSCLGLLRWDAGCWAVQPLAVRAAAGRRPVTAHTGDWALGPTGARAAGAEAAAGTVVDVLRERAGRLLRQ